MRVACGVDKRREFQTDGDFSVNIFLKNYKKE